MTERERELVARLDAIARDGLDPESAHEEADELLVEFIACPEVRLAFDAIVKWYA